MTTENVFSAVLTLSLMAGGAVAFGTELGQTRAPATAAVTMPTVTVVGHRATPTDVAVETESVEQRVQ